MNSLLLELDIQTIPDRDAVIIDHFNYDAQSASEQHDVLLLPHPKPKREEVKNYFAVDGSLAFPHANGHILGNGNALLTPIVTAPSTAYIYNPKDDPENLEDTYASGSQLNIVSAMQARNSARFVVLGTAEMLEDTWFDASVKSSSANSKKEKSANRDFARRLSAWTFKELGVLKVGKLQHYLNEPVAGTKGSRANDTSVGDLDVNPPIYRVKNEAVSWTKSL